jgi:zeaxanthin glucosyltransferase
MKLGLLHLYATGHINPSLALAAGLIDRGIEVIDFNILDNAGAIENAGVQFVPFGQKAMNVGYLAEVARTIASLSGEQSLHYFGQRMALLELTAFGELPKLINSLGIDALIIDQLFPGGSTLAEHLDLPFISLANALLINEEDGVPPPTLPWPYDSSAAASERNKLGWAGTRKIFQPLLEITNKQRYAWGLAPHSDFLQDGISSLLQLAQLPASFDFPRSSAPANLHYVGPLRHKRARRDPPFSWDWLSGKPLIYASLGTLQNGLPWIYSTIVEAAKHLDAQIVLSLGGTKGNFTFEDLPTNVLVVDYAPQEAVLDRASLCITHAGLNTVVDCLTRGVPMVAIPIASEQPGNAARIVWTGTGKMVPLDQLTPECLRTAVQDTMGETAYRANARRFAAEIAGSNPVAIASELVIDALRSTVEAAQSTTAEA